MTITQIIYAIATNPGAAVIAIDDQPYMDHLSAISYMCGMDPERDWNFNYSGTMGIIFIY